MAELIELGKASIPAVKQYLALADEQGIAVDDILDELAISSALLQNNDQHISGLLFQQLLGRLITRSQDTLFGLHTAKFVQPVSYSVLGFIAMNCETLGEAINKIQPFEKLVGDMGTSVIQKQGEQMSIAWTCAFYDPLVKRHMIDNCLASWLTFARYLTDDTSRPLQVLLSREEPSLRECQQYEALFQCGIRFNQVNDAIVFSTHLLSLPLNKGNKQLLPTLELHANALLKQHHSDKVLDQVKRVIEQNLLSGKITQQDIAAQLSMGSKTLQRRLKAEGVLFKTLVDEVRYERSQILLRTRSMTLNQVSVELGFAEPRSFFRWFQQISGLTPGQFRKNQH